MNETLWIVVQVAAVVAGLIALITAPGRGTMSATDLAICAPICDRRPYLPEIAAATAP
jgi:hypothetical protein